MKSNSTLLKFQFGEGLSQTINSAIHKAAGSLATGHSQNAAGSNAPQRLFLLVAPIHSLWDVFHWNGGTLELYQSNYGMTRNYYLNLDSNLQCYSESHRPHRPPGFDWYYSSITETCPQAVNGKPAAGTHFRGCSGRRLLGE